jgi:hypothetical protein
MTNCDDSIHPEGANNLQPGLTKREYFAAMTMQGLLVQNYPTSRVAPLADDAVLAADALIVALNKE